MARFGCVNFVNVKLELVNFQRNWLECTTPNIIEFHWANFRKVSFGSQFSGLRG